MHGQFGSATGLFDYLVEEEQGSRRLGVVKAT